VIDLRDPAIPPEAVARVLGLTPHPEGGHYRETWRDVPEDGGRGTASAILFLLASGERSHWHRVDADELWLWHAGAPLALGIAAEEGTEPVSHLLGPELAAGQVLQILVPRFCWQGAESLGAWTLVSCVVAPAFRFDGFELAPPGWRPGPRGGPSG
jgi:predicted cupin superfamily sugar epimerase